MFAERDRDKLKKKISAAMREQLFKAISKRFYVPLENELSASIAGMSNKKNKIQTQTIKNRRDTIPIEYYKIILDALSGIWVLKPSQVMRLLKRYFY